MMRHESVMPYTIIFLTYCTRNISAKLFEGKSKKVARLTQELAKLEADRLSKLVVVFGYEVSAYSISLNTPMHVHSHILCSLPSSSY